MHGSHLGEVQWGLCFCWVKVSLGLTVVQLGGEGVLWEKSGHLGSSMVQRCLTTLAVTAAVYDSLSGSTPHLQLIIEWCLRRSAQWAGAICAKVLFVCFFTWLPSRVEHRADRWMGL